MAVCPCLFQEFIPKIHDARLKTRGRDAYGVAIWAESEATALDWRRDYASLRYEPFDPPAEVLAGMRAYLQAMELHYGCSDLVATRGASWPTSAIPLASTCGWSTLPGCPSAPGSPRSSPRERMSGWRARAAALARQLAALDGVDPQWAMAFAEVPRHVFVPRFYPDLDTPELAISADPDEQA